LSGTPIRLSKKEYRLLRTVASEPTPVLTNSYFGPSQAQGIKRCNVHVRLPLATELSSHRPAPHPLEQ
jgi:hypothetical protein